MGQNQTTFRCGHGKLLLTRENDHDYVGKHQEVGALGATIKKRREELQEVTHTNAVEMDSIKTKAAEAVAKAKEDHEKKVRNSSTTVSPVSSTSTLDAGYTVSPTASLRQEGVGTHDVYPSPCAATARSFRKPPDDEVERLLTGVE